MSHPTNTPVGIDITKQQKNALIEFIPVVILKLFKTCYINYHFHDNFHKSNFKFEMYIHNTMKQYILTVITIKVPLENLTSLTERPKQDNKIVIIHSIRTYCNAFPFSAFHVRLRTLRSTTPRDELHKYCSYSIFLCSGDVRKVLLQ